MVFTTLVISQVSCIRSGWVEGGVVGVGEWANQRWVFPAIRAQTMVLCSEYVTEIYTTRRIGWDSHWQQFSTPLILFSAPSGFTGPVMHQCSFTGLAKSRLKAGLAIYSHKVDVSGQCMSVSLILGFSSCDNLVSFCKSSHKSYGI